MKFGFIKSELDGSEKSYSQPSGIKLPEKFSYSDYLGEIMNQRNKNICVPCSLSVYLNWNCNMRKNAGVIDNNIDLLEIFKSRKDKKSDLGMTFKDALYFLNHSGVSSDSGKLKISKYAMVKSSEHLKYAIYLNGPCVGGLPVYNSYNSKFWEGKEFEGCHAVSIIGYNKIGFIIRNSWGSSYADEVIGYDDFNKFYEVWTII